MVPFLTRAYPSPLYTAQGDDDEEFLKQLLEEFDKEFWEAMEKIREGLKTGELEETKIAAHSIKGSAAVFGATDLSEAAKVLEHAVKVSEDNPPFHPLPRSRPDATLPFLPPLHAERGERRQGDDENGGHDRGVLQDGGQGNPRERHDVILPTFVLHCESVCLCKK